MKFMKKIVVSSIVFIILYTILQTYLSYRLTIELSPTLTTCVYAFFGTELVTTAIIRIFDKEDQKELNQSSEASPSDVQDEPSDAQDTPVG